MIRTGGTALLLLLATGGGAVQAQTRPAPAYFIDAVFETTTAQQIARSCPSLSVNPLPVGENSARVMEQLLSDGFDPAQETLGMASPAAAIAERQSAFMARHDLRPGAGQAAVCAAGRAEIANGTIIGSYLLELPE